MDVERADILWPWDHLWRIDECLGIISKKRFIFTFPPLIVRIIYSIHICCVCSVYVTPLPVSTAYVRGNSAFVILLVYQECAASKKTK